MTYRADGSFLLSGVGRFFALGCGLGLVPRAPGTFGTLGGYLLVLPLLELPLQVALLVLVLTFVWGCKICDEAGSALGVPDHGSIVWDEIVAFALVLLVVPKTALAWGAAFLLFRFFDIAKPWPINVVDARFKNGFGVMLDDLVAAIFAIALYYGLAALAQAGL